MITQLRIKNYDGQFVPLGRDRRIMPRYPFTAAAEALDPQSRARMTARTSDISRGGCYVDTFCPFPKNSTVKLRLERDKEFLVAQAKVVYSKVGMGMGLCFTALEQPHKRILDKWIGELSGATPAEFDEEFAKPHASEAAPAAAHRDEAPANGPRAIETPATGLRVSEEHTTASRAGEAHAIGSRLGEAHTNAVHPAELLHTRERKLEGGHGESSVEPTAAVNNDAGFVLGELIIALMRRGTLSSSEGNSLLHKLVSPGSRS